MTTTVPAPATETRSTHRRTDAVIGAVYTLFAFLLLQNQWRDIDGTYLRVSGQDQAMWEWFFSVTARAVTTLSNPFFSDLQNAPDGVNMMANTSMLGWSVPLIPLTLLVGPTATFALALTAGLAFTAFGWYYLFSRTVAPSPAAAALGGLVAGFPPGMVSHANAHPNFTFLGVLPFLFLLTVRIGERTRVRRNAVLLGVLAAWQVLLGAEPLLLFALGVAVFAVFHLILRPRATGALLGRLALPMLGAGALSLLLVSVPLWWQFQGPQSYRHLEHGVPGNDLLTLISYPPQSVWGPFFPGEDLALNPTEHNAYFGLGLVLIALVAAIALRHRPVAVAAALTAVVFAAMSLGPEVTLRGEPTGITGVGVILDELPLLQSVLDTRYTLVSLPLMAMLVAMATDRVIAARRVGLGGVWAVAVAVALVPLIPAPLPTAADPVTPSFFTTGAWRDHVDDGSVVTFPLPGTGNADALRWQVQTDLQFRIAGGYFVGPSGVDDGRGRYGAVPRPTADIVQTVANTGIVPTLSDEQRAEADDDLRFWGADVVLVPPGNNQDQVLRTTVDLLETSPIEIDGTYVFDVRDR